MGCPKGFLPAKSLVVLYWTQARTFGPYHFRPCTFSKRLLGIRGIGQVSAYVHVHLSTAFLGRMQILPQEKSMETAFKWRAILTDHFMTLCQKSFLRRVARVPKVGSGPFVCHQSPASTQYPFHKCAKVGTMEYLVHAAGWGNMLHDVPTSSVCPHGQSAANNLSQGGEVRLDPEVLLCAPVRDPADQSRMSNVYKK